MPVLVPVSQSKVDNNQQLFSLVQIFLSFIGYGKPQANATLEIVDTAASQENSLQKFKDLFSEFPSAESFESSESNEFFSSEESVYVNPPLTISYENYKIKSQESSEENSEKNRKSPVIGFI